jgi:hypothetical protein
VQGCTQEREFQQAAYSRLNTKPFILLRSSGLIHSLYEMLRCWLLDDTSLVGWLHCGRFEPGYYALEPWISGPNMLCYIMLCMFFVRGASGPEKVSYWRTGRAELNYLQLLLHPTSPRPPAMSTRINGELRRLFPPSGTFLLVASPTVVSSTSSWTCVQAVSQKQDSEDRDKGQRARAISAAGATRDRGSN